MSLRGGLHGARVALGLPLRLRKDRLEELMCEAPPAPSRLVEVETALRVGLALLAYLARLRTPFWRNTCLYRSILECVLLRRSGRAAVVRIGVRRGGDDVTGAIAAHAWVEVGGRAWDEQAYDFALLRGAGGRI
jgi:hypothetical protein